MFLSARATSSWSRPSRCAHLDPNQRKMAKVQHASNARLAASKTSFLHYVRRDEGGFATSPAVHSKALSWVHGKDFFTSTNWPNYKVVGSSLTLSTLSRPSLPENSGHVLMNPTLASNMAQKSPSSWPSSTPQRSCSHRLPPF